MGCRIPGAETVHQFWELLRDGIDATGEMPPERMHYGQTGSSGRLITHRGGFLKDIEHFDPYFFGISPRDAMGIDPQQRLVLETAWRAAEDAGVTSNELKNSRTGVFAAICTDDYHEMLQAQAPEAEFQVYFSSLRPNGPGRVSYALGLTGPSIAVDSACSSSLVAVHLAVRSIQAGDCELAFAGGASLLLTTSFTRAYMRGGLLSPDGKCHTFSGKANGFVRSEGAGMVLLKRLSSALHDGDRIYAVIRGSSVNNDATSSPFMTPSRSGQVECIRAACAEAGISPAEIAYVEAHGTGTPTGDPIEVSALAEALGEGRLPNSPLKIGSCKTNIGHLEAAAGVAGLIKGALSVYHGAIPPSLNAGELNGKISWSEIPVSVQRTLAPWPQPGPRFAGINSFGIYGTNAHVVLGDAPQEIPSAEDQPERSWILPISARDEVSLKELAGVWKDHLTNSQATLADLCHTAATRRTHFDYRLAILGRTRKQLADSLEGWIAGGHETGVVGGRVSLDPNRKPVFVFSGVGSHWRGMAMDLYERYPQVRESLERSSAVLEQLSGRRIIDEIRKEETSSRLDSLEIAQPASFAVQVALSELWVSWGVVPAAVIGHSLGEIAAAHVAGALSLEDAARIVLARSELMTSLQSNGGMLACGLSEAEGEELIRGRQQRVAVGVINSSRSIVLSGDARELDEIEKELDGRQVPHRRVKTLAPTHSPLVEPVLEQLRQRIATIQPRETWVKLYSTVTGEPISGKQLTPGYWLNNLRDRVQFGPALERMLDSGERLFLEVSASPLLVGPMQESAAERSLECHFIPSLRRSQDGENSMLSSFARLYTAGFPVCWKAQAAAAARHADVPGHPFRRERIWLPDQDEERAVSQTVRPGAHPFLPLRVDPAGSPGVHVWEGTLDPSEHPFLLEHGAQSQPVLPAAAYYELAYTIGVEILGRGPKTLRGIQLRKAIFLSPKQKVRLQAVLAPSGIDSFSLKFYRAQLQDWELCCEMTLRDGPATPPPALFSDRDLKHSSTPDVTSAEFYELATSSGLDYGPLYQGVRRAWRREREGLAELEMPEPIQREIGFHIHPAFLDAVLQVPLLTISRDTKALLPATVEEVYFAESFELKGRMWGHARTYGSLQYDAALHAEDGSVLFQIRNTTCRELASSTPKLEDSVSAKWFYEKRWEESAVPLELGERARWVLVGDELNVKLLGEQLTRHGHNWEGVSSGSNRPALKRLAEAQDASRKRVVYLASLAEDWQGADPNEAQQRLCGGLLTLLQTMARELATSAARLFVPARSVNLVQPGDRVNVPAGPLFGLCRTAANEFPRFQVTTLDLDLSNEALLTELLADSEESEVAWRAGRRYVARIGRLDIAHAGRRKKRLRPDGASSQSYRVVSRNPGSVDQVTVEAAVRKSPEKGEIEVRVAAAGMNFLDVLRSLNMGPGQKPGAVSFGMEFAGEVTRLGEGVTNIRVGDRIMAMTFPGETCFQPWVTIPADFALPIPQGFTMAQAAGCLAAYQTAWYAFAELARMRAGDRVLIHAAAGGVGLAAVNIAKYFGAEIFATAGSNEKRDYLHRCGVKHVMNSRTLDFEGQVLEATGGQGVDLVLNSISGAAIAASVATLAPGGRFLEIGKRDIYANAALDLFPFRRNLSYYAIDMLGLTETHRDTALRMLKEVADRLSTGDLPPLPVTTFASTKASEAFRYMAQSRQIGKVVVTFAEPEVDAEIPEGQLVRADRTYLITGGMSGIGLECARLLVAQGAGNLVLLSRRTPSRDEAEIVSEMRKAGVNAITAVEDVSNEEGVRRVIEAIDRDMPPLAGVIHSAGIARDSILERLNWAQFEEVFAPKVRGSWNLQKLLNGRELDFFVLFSSVASWLGSAGQGNYAAANAFLDSLGEHRQSLGLPTLTINWGPWTGIGMLQRHKLRPAPIFGEEGIRAELGVRCLSTLLASDCSHATVMSADWKVWPGVAPALSAKPLYTNLRSEMAAGESSAAPDNLASQLARVSKNEGTGLVRARAIKEVVAVLRIPEDRLDSHADLQRLGLDSLMAVELSVRLESAFGLGVPVMTLLKGLSLDEMSALLYSGLAAPLNGHSTMQLAPAAAVVVHSNSGVSRIGPETWMIQEGDPGPALFCLGGVKEWIFVAQQIGAGQRVLAVVPSLAESDRSPTIEAFAAAAVKLIREQQPSGPYHLAGWSVWGLVGFEIAQQLSALSEEVPTLALVDTFLPLTSRKLSKAGQLAAWARLEQRRLAYHVQKVRQGETELTTDYVRQRFDAFMRFRVRPMVQAALKDKPAEIRSSKDLGEILLAASMKYGAKHYPGPVLFCAATDRHEGSVEDYVAEWKNILSGEIDVLPLSGDHVTMFDPENVQPLVNRLNFLLR